MSNNGRFPTPVAEAWDWQLRGACRGRGSSLFFHPDETPREGRTIREAAAKAVCAHCPVRAACAAHALAGRELYGVWGGLTEGERQRLLAIGWEDVADRQHHWVDVPRLQARLRRAPHTVNPATVCQP